MAKVSPLGRKCAGLYSSVLKLTTTEPGSAVPKAISTLWLLNEEWSLNKMSVIPGQDQYASTDYQRALRSHGMVCSMSRKGDC